MTSPEVSAYTVHRQEQKTSRSVNQFTLGQVSRYHLPQRRIVPARTAKQAEETTNKVLAHEPEATTSTALRSALSLLGKK